MSVVETGCPPIVRIRHMYFGNFIEAKDICKDIYDCEKDASANMLRQTVTLATAIFLFLE